MRVVDRQTFMRLPAGTFFAKGQPVYWEGLCIKGDTIFSLDGEPIDWCYLDPAWVKGREGEECIEEMMRAIDDGQSRQMEDAWTRDGRFDSADIFLVLEYADLMTLRGYVDEAIALFASAETGE